MVCQTICRPRHLEAALFAFIRPDERWGVVTVGIFLETAVNHLIVMNGMTPEEREESMPKLSDYITHDTDWHPSCQ